MKPISKKPHDAGSHEQKMTPALQRAIDEADKRERDKAAMPANCPTPTGCRENGCHGACLPPNPQTPSQEAREYPLTDDDYDRLQAEYDLCGVDGRLRDFAEAVIEHDRKARQQEATDLEELRRAICGIGIVGRIDGHELIRRDSVIDLIDRRRHADR